jgi:cobyrinic acid a,c-diamide synthase
MSVQRLVVSGLEPGPAVGLAAGALVAALGARVVVRPVTVGLDLPLWRLLHDGEARPPRVLDPALHPWPLAAELQDSWSDGVDLMLLICAEPVLDRWQGVDGSRAVDVAVRFDAPLVLVLDARDRGPTVAAAVLGVRALARRAELAGVIVVGGDDREAGGELGALLRDEVGLPLLGWIPPQLSEQFAREQTVTTSGPRQFGPRPASGSAQRLCREAATYLQTDEIETAAGRGGYLPGAERRVLVPAPVAAGLKLAVGWGPPLQPLALENFDLLQAMGVDLVPLHLARDRELPPGVSGLLLCGQVEERQLDEFAANKGLHEALAAAVDDGLPTLACGGGALLLLRRLSDSRGHSHELAGVLPAEAELLEWYERPRYLTVRATPGNPFDEGDGLLCELFDLEFLVLEREMAAYEVHGPGEAQGEGFVHGRCLATTLYPSLPARPALALRLVETMRAAGPRA